MANPTDHLATVRAALDLMLRAWPGSLDVRRFVDDTGNDAAAVIDKATGETIAICDNEDRDDHAAPAEDAAAIVALRNAAPAIAALADECERLRARIAKAEEVVAAARALGSYAWTDRLDDSRTSDDAKEDESKLSSAVWQYDNPPNLHPDGCHTTVASAFRDCSGDGHHECRTCTRFDEDERAKRIGEF